MKNVNVSLKSMMKTFIKGDCKCSTAVSIFIKAFPEPRQGGFFLSTANDDINQNQGTQN